MKKGNEEELSIIYHKTKMTPFTLSDNFDEWFVENIIERLKKKLDDFQQRDSGKALKCVLYLEVSFIIIIFFGYFNVIIYRSIL